MLVEYTIARKIYKDIGDLWEATTKQTELILKIANNQAEQNKQTEAILKAINRQTEAIAKGLQQLHKDNEEILKEQKIQTALLRQLVNKEKSLRVKRWDQFLDMIQERKAVHTDTIMRKLKVSRSTALRYMRKIVDISDEWAEQQTEYGIKIIRVKK